MKLGNGGDWLSGEYKGFDMAKERKIYHVFTAGKTAEEVKADGASIEASGALVFYQEEEGERVVVRAYAGGAWSKVMDQSSV